MPALAPTFSQSTSGYAGGTVTIASTGSSSIVYGNSLCHQYISLSTPPYVAGPGYPTSTTYVAPLVQMPGSQIVAYGIDSNGIAGPAAEYEVF
jgi:hypothetical protein